MKTENLFLGKKVLVVTAHPDDESPLAAGTIRQIVDSGGEVHLVCATLGEKGRAYVSTQCTETELKEMRRQELLSVGGLLGLSSISVLNYSDGQLAESIVEFKVRLTNVVKQLQPNFIISFGPDGYTGHKDHVATYVVCKSVALEQGVRFVMFCLPPEPYRQECQKVFLKKRKFGAYSESQTCIEPNIKISVDGELKLRAMECHASQVAGLNPYNLFSPALARHVLSFEYYYLD